MRLFIALALDPELRERIHRWCGAQRLAERGWRVLRAESLHLTLEFLGEREQKEVPALGKAIARAAGGQDPFRLTLEAWDVFPPRGRPRVLWAGVGDGAEEVTALARRVRSELAGRESSMPEGFRPHVTLARARRGVAPTRPGKKGAGTVFGTLQVERITLFRSRLGTAGASYETVATRPLGGGGE